MPLIQAYITRNIDDQARRALADEITESVVENLKESFACELGFTANEKEKAIAKEVIGRFAPGWVWISFQDFEPVIAGKKLSDSDVAARFDIGLLEGSMREDYQDSLITTVADAAREMLQEYAPGSNINLAVTNITANVRMSVPDNPDNLLRAGGVHAFLARQIQSELVSVLK